MSETRPLVGVRLWLLVALPLVAQFAFVGAGVALASVLFDLPERMDFYSLPQAVVILVAYALFALVTIAVARRLGAPATVLGAVRTPLGPAIGLGALALVAGLLASAALEPIFHGAESQGLDPGPFPGTATAVVAIALSAISVAGAAALTEELYFRGLLYGQLDARLGRAAAVVGSAGAFGLVHFQPDAFPTLFALGLILGLLRLRTRSTWPGVAVHAANNGLAFVYLLAS